MPATDFVEVSVVLNPKAGSLASLGVSNILHTLTDDQDAAIGAIGSVQLLSAGEAWKTTLADVGVVQGEAAYADVEAHFSQEHVPDRAYLGRRGSFTGTQIRGFTIEDDGGGFAVVGDYRIIAEGGPYVAVATGAETPTAIRDTLDGLITAGTHASFANSTSGGDTELLTATAVGFNIDLVVEGPTGGITAIQTASAKEVKKALEVDTNIITGGDGLYTWTVQTTTGQLQFLHNETSGSGTPTSVAAALKVLYDAGPSDLFGATVTATLGVLSLVAAVAGTPGVVSIASPLSDATITIASPNYNIGDDITFHTSANKNFYHFVSGSHLAIDLLQGAAAVEPLRKGFIVQSSDADIRTSVDTDVFSQLQDLARKRTIGIEHPIDAEGVHSAWVGDINVDGPGKVNYTATVISGFSAQDFGLDPNAPINIAAKEGAYLERYEGRQQDIMSGGYAFNGRPFDLMRAIDTFCINVESKLLDLLVVSRIVPYSNDGIAQGEATIRECFELAVVDGYGQSLELIVPDITDASTPDAERGIWPAFSGHIVMQVGTFKIKANFTVSQN